LILTGWLVGWLTWLDREKIIFQITIYAFMTSSGVFVRHLFIVVKGLQVLAMPVHKIQICTALQ
jgi:hypothetical protein